MYIARGSTVRNFMTGVTILAGSTQALAQARAQTSSPGDWPMVEVIPARSPQRAAQSGGRLAQVDRADQQLDDQGEDTGMVERVDERGRPLGERTRRTGARPAADEQLYEFSFRNMPLRQVIEQMAAWKGKSVLAIEDVPEDPLTYISDRQYTLQEAFNELNQILFERNLYVIDLEDNLKVQRLGGIQREPGIPIFMDFEDALDAGLADSAIVTVFHRFANVEVADIDDNFRSFLPDTALMRTLDRSNRVVLTTNIRNIRNWWNIVARFDSDAPEQPPVGKLVAYQLTYARAQDVVNLIQQVIRPRYSIIPQRVPQPGQPPRPSSGLSERVDLFQDERTNTVFVFANRDVHGQIDEMIKAVDIDPAALFVRRVFEIQNMSADEMQNLIVQVLYEEPAQPGSVMPNQPGQPPPQVVQRQPGRNITRQSITARAADFAKPNIVVYDRTDRLVVTGVPEQVERIAQFIAEFDRPAGDLNVTTIKIEHVPVTSIAQQIAVLMADAASGLTIFPDASTNLLHIRAKGDTLDRVRELIERSDRAEFATQTFTHELEFARPSQVQQTLTGVFTRNQQPQGGGPAVTIQANDQAGVLVVSATPEVWETEVLPAIEKIDAEARESVELEVRSYPLRFADAQASAQNLSQMFGGKFSSSKGDVPVTVSPDLANNAVVVRTNPAGHAQALRAIEQLDVNVGTYARTIELIYAKADDVAAQLRALYGKMAPNVQIVSDGRSNTVTVGNARLDQWAEIEQYARQLEASAADVVKFSVVLRYAKPSEVANQLKAVYQDETPGRANQVRLQPNDSSGTLVVSAPKGERTQVEAFIQQIDDQTARGRELITQSYELEFADAKSVADGINNVFKGGFDASYGRVPLSAFGDPRSNTVFVYTSKEGQDKAGELIRQGDVARADTRVLQQVFSPRHIQPQVLGQAITQQFPPPPNSQPQEQVRVSVAGQQITVSALPNDMARIGELIDRLDRPAFTGVSTKLYAVESVAAATLGGEINQHLQGLIKADPNAYPAVVTADAATGQLKVTGTADQIALVDRLLQEAEVNALTQRVQQKTYDLTQANATDVARQVQQLLQAQLAIRGRPAPITVAAVNDRRLIVSAPADLIAKSDEWVKTMDSAPATARTDAIQIVELSQGDPAELAATLNTAITATKQEGGLGGLRVNVTASPSGRALLLTGDARDIQVVVRHVAALEARAEGAEFYVHPVRGSKYAEDIAKVLQAMFTGNNAPIIASDSFEDEVYVSGRPEAVARVKAALDRLDPTREMLDQLEAAKGPGMDLLFRPAPAGDAEKLADKLETLLGRSGIRSARVESFFGQLIISVPKDRREEALKLMEQLQIPDEVDEGRQMAIRPLSGASAVDAARLLQSAYQQTGGKMIVNIIPPGGNNRGQAVPDGEPADDNPVPPPPPANNLRGDSGPRPGGAGPLRDEAGPPTPPAGPMIGALIHTLAGELFAQAAPQQGQGQGQAQGQQQGQNQGQPGLPAVPGSPDPTLGMSNDFRRLAGVVAAPRAGEPPVTLHVDSDTNIMFIEGTEEQIERLDELIDVLSKADVLGEADLHVYKLKVADPNDVAQALNQLYGAGGGQSGVARGQGNRRQQQQPNQNQNQNQQQGGGDAAVVQANDKPFTAIGDRRTGFVIVRCDQREWRKVRELVDQLDDAPKPGGETTLKIIPLKRLGADEARRNVMDILGIRDTSANMGMFPFGGRGGGGGGGGGGRGSEWEQQQQARYMQQMMRSMNIAGGDEDVNVQDVHVTANTSTNSVIVQGPASVVQLVEKLLVDLEQEDAPPLVEVTTYKLQHAKPAFAAQAIDKLLAGATTARSARSRGNQTRGRFPFGGQEDTSPLEAPVLVQADERGNQVIITASRKDLPVIEEVIKQVDVPPDATTLAQLSPVVVDVKHVRASQIQDRLQDMVMQLLAQGGGPQGNTGVLQDQKLSVVADDTTNRLIITASPLIRSTIDKVIAELDVPTRSPVERQLMPLALKHADAEELAARIGEVMRNAGSDTNNPEPPPAITADSSTSSIIVFGTPRQFESVQRLVTMLDTPEAQQGGIQLVQVRGGRASALAPMIESAINGSNRSRGATQVRIVADDRTGTLLVSGSARQASEVRALVTRLEEIKPPGSSQVVFIPFDGDPGPTVELLNRMIQPQGTTGGGGQNFRNNQRGGNRNNQNRGGGGGGGGNRDWQNRRGDASPRPQPSMLIDADPSADWSRQLHPDVKPMAAVDLDTLDIDAPLDLDALAEREAVSDVTALAELVSRVVPMVAQEEEPIEEPTAIPDDMSEDERALAEQRSLVMPTPTPRAEPTIPPDEREFLPSERPRRPGERLDEPPAGEGVRPRGVQPRPVREAPRREPTLRREPTPLTPLQPRQPLVLPTQPGAAAIEQIEPELRANNEPTPLPPRRFDLQELRERQRVQRQAEGAVQVQENRETQSRLLTADEQQFPAPEAQSAEPPPQLPQAVAAPIDPNELEGVEIYSDGQNIIVVGDSEQAAKVRTLIEQLQRDTGSTVRLIRVQQQQAAAVAETVRRALEPFVRSGQRFAVIADTLGNNLIVTGNADQVRRAQDLVRQLDAVRPAEEVLIVELQRARAAAVAPLVADILAAGQRPPGAQAPTVVVDERSNSLVITGPRSELARASALTKQLDVKAVGVGNEADVLRIPIQNARVTTLAEVLTGLLTQGGRTPGAAGRQQGRPAAQLEEFIRRLRVRLSDRELPELDLEQPIRIVPDEQTSSLFLVSTPQNLEVLAEIVALLDTVPITPPVSVQIRSLNHARATEVAEIIRDVFEQGKQLATKPGEAGPAARAGQGRGQTARAAAALAQPDSPAGQALVKPINIFADERTNSVVLSGEPIALTLANSLITSLDQPGVSFPGLITTAFRVRENDVARVAERLETYFDDKIAKLEAIRPGTELTYSSFVDPRSSTLIITGTRELVTEAAAIIERMEDGGAAVDFRVFKLSNAAAANLVPTLRSIFQQRERQLNATGGAGAAGATGAGGQAGAITIEADVPSNAIIASGLSSEIQALAEIIQRLDVPGAEGGSTEVLFLENARADQIVPLLNNVFNNRGATSAGGGGATPQGGSAGQAYVFAPGATPNSVVVRAPSGQLQEIRNLVTRLDRAVLETPAGLELRVVKLTEADAETVVETMQDFLGQRGGAAAGGQAGQRTVVTLRNPVTGQTLQAIREDVTLTADPRLNAVLVQAPAGSADLIEAFIRTLDQQAPSAQVRLFRLRNSDATAMFETLQTLFDLDEQGRQRTGTERQNQGPEQRIDVGGVTANVSAPAAAASPGAAGGVVGGGRQQIQITPDTRTNSIVAAGSPGYLEVVERIILQLDSIESLERVTQVFELRNARAEDVQEALNDNLTQDAQAVEGAIGKGESPERALDRQVSITAFEEANAIIVSASPRRFTQIRQLIDALDVAPPQVMIQALLAEVTLDNTTELGMDWGFQDLQFTRALARYGDGRNRKDVIVGTDLGAAGAPGSLGGFSFTFTGEDFTYLLRALESEGRLEVLSRPQLMVENNETGTLQVGEQVPIITGSSVSAETGIVTNNVENQDVGVILEVTPRINPDGWVNLEIAPEISALSASSIQLGAGVNAPIITRRRAETVVNVRDGETIVIGGLITTRDNVREDKIPVLGDVPILGLAGRVSQVEKVKTELLIVLTPSVVRTSEDANRLSIEEVNRSGLLERVRRSPLMQGLQDRDRTVLEPPIEVDQPYFEPVGEVIAQPLPPPLPQTVPVDIDVRAGVTRIPGEVVVEPPVEVIPTPETGPSIEIYVPSDADPTPPAEPTDRPPAEPVNEAPTTESAAR